MDFYKKLSNYYDVLYKEDDSIINFLSKTLSNNSSILDLSCKTGINSIRLSELGFNVTGIDINSFMVDKARDNRKFAPVKFYSYDMRDISSKFKEQQFDEIICLNNSLSFLMDIEEVSQTLHSTFKCLKEGGTLILEIKNHKNIFNNKIVKEIGTTSFTQEYFKDSSSNKIILKEKLLTKNKYLETEETTIEELLLDLSKEDFNKMLEKTGFINIEFFSDFNNLSYNENSKNIIIRAIREESLLDDSEDYEDYDVNVVKTKSKCCRR